MGVGFDGIVLAQSRVSAAWSVSAVKNGPQRRPDPIAGQVPQGSIEFERALVVLLERRILVYLAEIAIADSKDV